MSTARYVVTAQLDSAGGKKKGTITIDRETGEVTIRPLRSRMTYRTTLAELADLVVKRALTAGFAEAYAPKAARRAGR